MVNEIASMLIQLSRNPLRRKMIGHSFLLWCEKHQCFGLVAHASSLIFLLILKIVPNAQKCNKYSTRNKNEAHIVQYAIINHLDQHNGDSKM